MWSARKQCQRDLRSICMFIKKQNKENTPSLSAWGPYWDLFWGHFFQASALNRRCEKSFVCPEAVFSLQKDAQSGEIFHWAVGQLSKWKMKTLPSGVSVEGLGSTAFLRYPFVSSVHIVASSDFLVARWPMNICYICFLNTGPPLACASCCFSCPWIPHNWRLLTQLGSPGEREARLIRKADWEEVSHDHLYAAKKIEFSIILDRH